MTSVGERSIATNKCINKYLQPKQNQLNNVHSI